MKLLFNLSLCIAALTAATALNAQEMTGAAASYKIEGAVRIRMNTLGTAPDVVIFDPAKALPDSEIPKLQQRLFGNRPEDSWSLIRSEDDQIGMTHIRYQQLYKNLEVEGCVYIFHIRDRKIVSANGDFTAQIDLSATAAISSDQAIALAAAGMKVPVSPESTDQTEAELVVSLFGGKPVLTYRCMISSRQPLVSAFVYIDANNGKVLREVDRICAIDVPGTAVTHFSGTHAIITDSVSPGNYLLKESGRNIETLRTANFEPFSDEDNYWNNINNWMDEFAGDVHFGAETTYDFFYDHFGRVSYDNNGGLVLSYANNNFIGANAYWMPGPSNAMHFGTGDANYFPFASLEVAGHEYTHGVVEYSAGLVSYGEPSALNESFSDIFGNTIRFLTAPDVATWYIGDQLLRPGGTGDSALRNMANPNEFLHADTYDGLYFNTGDVRHFDCGIQNYWYYLLTEGGSGTNDLGNSYSVTGIGLNDAIKITYRNLAYYLTPHSDFYDSRDGAEQAAVDLFGLCSEQHVQTIKAWYAVGVGPNETTMQIEAAYETTSDFSCNAPLSTQFFGNGNYASYSWNFGDGTTSSLQNPTHVYTNDGFYTVTLIVSNNNSCQNADTLIVPNGVAVGDINPVAAFTTQVPLVVDEPVAFFDASSYGPTSWAWDFGDGGTSTLQNPSHTFADTGVYNVQLTVQNCHGTHTVIQQIHVADYILFCHSLPLYEPYGAVTDAGGINGNYGNDQYCGITIRPCNAALITLTFQEFNLEDGVDWLYITDGNNMMLGIFSGSTLPPTITTTTGVLDLSLNSDSQNDLSGIRATYTSVPGPEPGPNTTQFSATPEVSQPGEPVLFLENCTLPPLYWYSWNFGDGTTSFEHNPWHTYTQPGVYAVTLTTNYCNGYTGTRTMNHYVGNVGLEELTTGNLLTVAPNPFSESFVIAPVTAIGDVDLRISDMSGREVFRQNISEIQPEGIAITPNMLSSGQYLLEIGYSLNGGNRIERYKIQVQR